MDRFFANLWVYIMAGGMGGGAYLFVLQEHPTWGFWTAVAASIVSFVVTCFVLTRLFPYQKSTAGSQDSAYNSQNQQPMWKQLGYTSVEDYRKNHPAFAGGRHDTLAQWPTTLGSPPPKTNTETKTIPDWTQRTDHSLKWAGAYASPETLATIANELTTIQRQGGGRDLVAAHKDDIYRNLTDHEIRLIDAEVDVEILKQTVDEVVVALNQMRGFKK